MMTYRTFLGPIGDYPANCGVIGDNVGRDLLVQIDREQRPTDEQTAEAALYGYRSGSVTPCADRPPVDDRWWHA